MNFSPDNKHIFKNRKRKAFEILENLPYLVVKPKDKLSCDEALLLYYSTIKSLYHHVLCNVPVSCKLKVTEIGTSRGCGYTVT